MNETLALKSPNVHAPDHTVWLAGLRLSPQDKKQAPLIVERRDQDFIEGLLADLANPALHAELRTKTPPRRDGMPRLFQPVQRVFNCVVLEAFCEMPGWPRVDPMRIESAGIVVRKLDGDKKLAWLKAGTKAHGWEAIDEDIDPKVDRRARAVSLGHTYLDEKAPSQQRVLTAGSLKLANAKVPVEEQVIPLFVAPPEVCDSAARTVLFAHLPVTASEMTESGPDIPNYGQDPQERAQLQEHLVSYLKVGSATPLPLANRGFTSEDFKAAAQSQASAITHAEYESLDKLTLFLQQLHHEFDAFGTSAPAQTIMSELAKINVETDVTELVLGVPKLVTKTRPASDFVREAKRVLLDTEPGATLNMPHRWGAVSQTIADAIFTATLDALKAQYARVKPATGRYEATRAGEEPRYVLRAFIRLKAETEGCPTRLVWSQYSEPYTIAPWWESSGAPVPVIAMPDLFDPNALKALKPNVAFALPPKLANLLRKDPKKLRDGEGDGKGWEIGWICSFSLPIITLCAFIVLNIFLSLFAMIFFWLPFLKICIPYPKSK